MVVGAEGRLQEMGIVLPKPLDAGGNYIPAKTVGRMVFLAGVISIGAEGVITGTVGSNRSINEGYEAAKLCALAQLAALKAQLAAGTGPEPAGELPTPKDA